LGFAYGFLRLPILAGTGRRRAERVLDIISIVLIAYGIISSVALQVVKDYLKK